MTPKVRAIIFDDFSWNKINLEEKKNIFSATHDISIDVKYSWKIIKADILKIVTTNNLDRILKNTSNDLDENAIRNRISILTIKEPLFNKNRILKEFDKTLFSDFSIKYKKNNKKSQD
jgi:hypothetical protein